MGGEVTEKETGSWWALAVTNLGIVALVGFALWFTHSLWAFLGLLFLFAIKPSSIKTQCPKCNHEFVGTKKDDEENG